MHEFIVSTFSLVGLTLGKSLGQTLGDSFSPFLFTLVTGALSYLLEKGGTGGLSNGFEIGSNRVQVSHLQHADDTILFLEANSSGLANAKKVIYCCGRVIGLEVNLYKSSLMEINVPQEELTRSEIMECQIESWPINYFWSSFRRQSHFIGFLGAHLALFSEETCCMENIFPWGRKITLIKATMTNLLVLW